MKYVSEKKYVGGSFLMRLTSTRNSCVQETSINDQILNYVPVPIKYETRPNDQFQPSHSKYQSVGTLPPLIANSLHQNSISFKYRRWNKERMNEPVLHTCRAKPHIKSVNSIHDNTDKLRKYISDSSIPSVSPRNVRKIQYHSLMKQCNKRIKENQNIVKIGILKDYIIGKSV